MFGSSPRTWGTRVEDEGLKRRHRFIPTYMGNAYGVNLPSLLETVHPHVHGERSVPERIVEHLDGSSPRTWGTQERDPVFVDSVRFIPTYMGNAAASMGVRALVTVHPHVHGERSGAPPTSRLHPGSSPRTWGTLVMLFPLNLISRFIPTYMGNADPEPAPPTPSPVHPHVHGERCINPCKILDIYGSSPRTWGTHPEPGADEARARFIPTYMGNAVHRTGCPRLSPVHPHVHGERKIVAPGNKLVDGSSPRTWGTRKQNRSESLSSRFIPTYMGNAISLYSYHYIKAVHPHVHGERNHFK